MRVVAVAVAALAGTIGPPGRATVTSLPATAGAHAAMTVTLRTELQCGRPSAGAIVVSFPRAVHVPAHIDRRSTRLDGALPAAVKVSGRVVALTVPAVQGMTCDSIVVGTVRVVFLRSAGLANPAHAGHYSVSIRAGTTAGTARLRIL